MDLVEKLREHAGRIPNRLAAAKRSEANTSLFLVMPFLQALGYSVHNPNDVEAEFTADIVSTSNKVDFAIKIEGKPAILVEVKRADLTLLREHTKQLHYYFSSKLDVRFGLLTNGVEYRFYADLDRPNVMDDDPFFTLDLLYLEEHSLDVLQLFTKSGFRMPDAMEAARRSKDRRLVRHVLKAEFDPLSPEATEFILNIVLPGETDESRRADLTRLVNQEWQEFIHLPDSRIDFPTDAGPNEPTTLSNSDFTTFLEKTKFLEKYSLDGSVEVPVFADFEGHRFEASLSLYGKLHNAAAIIRYDEEWLTPLVAGKRTRMTIDPNATYYVNGMTYWQLRDPASGESRPINDLRYDEELLRRVLSNSN